MKKLNPNDLHVTSFGTEASFSSSIVTKPNIELTNDPTAATHCFWCPIEIATDACL